MIAVPSSVPDAPPSVSLPICTGMRPVAIPTIARPATTAATTVSTTNAKDSPLRHALAQVRKAHAGADRLRLAEAAAGVRADDAQAVALGLRADAHRSAFSLRLEPVLDRVLDERGQHERRERGVHELGRHVDLER